jgi:hypothetical protein
MVSISILRKNKTTNLPTADPGQAHLVPTFAFVTVGSGCLGEIKMQLRGFTRCRGVLVAAPHLQPAVVPGGFHGLGAGHRGRRLLRPCWRTGDHSTHNGDGNGEALPGRATVWSFVVCHRNLLCGVTGRLASATDATHMAVDVSAIWLDLRVVARGCGFA